jgi:SEC-C motif
MYAIPAICDKCGVIFAPPAIVLGPGVSGVRMSGNRVGPCPACGNQWGRIPDGTYETVRGTLRMLLKDPASAESLQRLANILQAAWEVHADQATVADQIEAQVPELRGFAQSLRIANIDWKWWIIFLLTVVQTLAALGVIGPKPERVSDEQIERVMRHVIQDQASTTSTTTAPEPGKTGRNDPCPCGSGKNYKRCHLVAKP